MNILMINQPPFNRGDESAHKGLLRTLRKRMTSANIRFLYPMGDIESIRQYSKGIEGVEYLPSPEAFLKAGLFVWQGMHKGRTWLWHFHPLFQQYKNHYKWADVVVCAPGGICMGGFQDWHHIFLLKMAKYFHKPLVYYGRSFGPFPTETQSNREFKRVSLEMLNYFSFLSIRDHKTEVLAKELGISYIPTVDSAFLDSPSVYIPWEIRRAISGGDYMVFVPNYLRWHFAYKDIEHKTVVSFYSNVIKEIWNQYPELKIVMLPQLFCGSRYEVSDVEFFRDMAEDMSDERVVVVPDCYSSDVQQAIIKEAKFLIGARYHSIVFAINQNTPFIALSYEHKISGLLETLGKEDCCIEFSNTLRSKDGQDSALSDIKKKMMVLKKDEDVQKRAKTVADNCMKQLVDYLNTFDK